MLSFDVHWGHWHIAKNSSTNIVHRFRGKEKLMRLLGVLILLIALIGVIIEKSRLESKQRARLECPQAPDESPETYMARRAQLAAWKDVGGVGD